MKTIYTISWLTVMTVFLCGCPYSSSHGIDEVPGIYVEDALMGTWSAFIKGPGPDKLETVKVSFSKKTETEYNISFSGYLDQLRPFGIVSADSVNGSAFMSTIDGRQFLNITIASRIYIAELRLKDDKLTLLPLAEHFTNKMIFSSQALRQSVFVHYKSRVNPVFDDDFCLRGMIKE